MRPCASSECGRTSTRRFGGDERGIALLDFALLAPAAFVLMYGAVESARYLGIRNTMQDAVQLAARTAGVARNSDEAFLRPIAMDRLVVGQAEAVEEFTVTRETAVPGVDRVTVTMRYRFELIVGGFGLGPFTIETSAGGYIEL
jgi:Flp pilus assembly protein TadG